MDLEVEVNANAAPATVVPGLNYENKVVDFDIWCISTKHEAPRPIDEEDPSEIEFRKTFYKRDYGRHLGYISICLTGVTFEDREALAKAATDERAHS